jgi:hypothetical protein
VFGGAAELKDVPLGNADMFQQLPRRMRATLGFAPAKIFREVLERFAQIDMRFCLGEQIGNMLADGIGVLHGN